MEFKYLYEHISKARNELFSGVREFENIDEVVIAQSV